MKTRKVVYILIASFFHITPIHSASLKWLSTKTNFSRLNRLPSEFEALDPKLNFPVFENEKFYGIKTGNTFGEGIKILNKKMKLIWEKKPPEKFERFVTECKWHKYRYLTAYMSKNYKYLLLIMGAPIDLGPYFEGLEIYKKTTSGYQRTGCIKYSTSCEIVYIDEEKEQFYSVGEYPDGTGITQIICFNDKGEIVWSRPDNLNFSEEEFHVSKNSQVIQYLSARSFINSAGDHVFIKRMFLWDRNGNFLGQKTFETPTVKTAISGDGKTAIAAIKLSIFVFQTDPYELLKEIIIPAGKHEKSQAISVGISGNGRWIVFTLHDPSKNTHSNFLVLYDSERDMFSSQEMPAGLGLHCWITFESEDILEIISGDKIFRFRIVE